MFREDRECGRKMKHVSMIDSRVAVRPPPTNDPVDKIKACVDAVGLPSEVLSPLRLLCRFFKSRYRHDQYMCLLFAKKSFQSVEQSSAGHGWRNCRNFKYWFSYDVAIVVTILLADSRPKTAGKAICLHQYRASSQMINSSKNSFSSKCDAIPWCCKHRRHILKL